MKAIRIYEFGEPEVMKIVKVERPIPKADEILIKVYAASVNPADYIIRTGGNEGLKPYLKLPMALGIDGAGVVEEIGSEVTLFKKGDRVYGVPNYLDGSYTEFLAAKADQKPINLPLCPKRLILIRPVPCRHVPAWPGAA